VVAGVAALILALATSAWESWPAGACFTIAAFVTACIVGEFWRGARVRHALGGIGWPGAVAQLVARNRRRYGGYIVHLGVVVLFIGLAGSTAFASEGDLALRPGQQGTVAGFTVVNEHSERIPSDGHKAGVGVRLGVFREGERVATLFPHRNVYFLEGGEVQPSTEVAISTGPARDLYAVLIGLTPDGLARVSLFVNPLVMWLWVSGIIIALGALIAVWPFPRAVRAPAPARAGAVAGPLP
jgi:cytochrome c-type biogenesis protein CcmF